MDIRQLFRSHLAQTSETPVGLHITKAEGCNLFDINGKAYLDLIGGISVSNVGHSRKEVVEAVCRQSREYMHIMVYGELLQSPQIEYASSLVQLLPAGLDSVYFTNSGAEAVEGALKLARRVTGRPEVIACNYSYHGSTTGALSIIGDEYWRNAFRPLLPGVYHYNYNSQELLDAIGSETACVVLETVQAEAGVIKPDPNWLEAVRMRCTEVGTLLVLDEIQCGFGRTGTLWGFQQFRVQPDILLLGKALGGGMPLGAFISSLDHMQQLSKNPVLGHITTFGGHPVSCAAGKAALEVLNNSALLQEVRLKEAHFLKLLHHRHIVEVRSAGLLIAIELASADMVVDVLQKALQEGLFSDWFLFAPQCIRIAPPLTITIEEIEQACTILLDCLNKV